MFTLTIFVNRKKIMLYCRSKDHSEAEPMFSSENSKLSEIFNIHKCHWVRTFLKMPKMVKKFINNISKSSYCIDYFKEVYVYVYSTEQHSPFQFDVQRGGISNSVSESYPVENLLVNKFDIPVSRVDDVYGDKLLLGKV